MKTIREIQEEKIEDLYRNLLRFRDEKPDMVTLEKLSREVLISSLRTPLSGKYRLPRHDSVDTNALNVELGLVKTDAETIYDYLDETQKRLRTLRYVADVWKQNANSKAAMTLMELAKMTSPVFIDGFTEELDLIEIVSKEDTTLVIDEEGTISLPMIVNKSKPYIYQKKDVSIQRVGEGLTATILGDPTDILNKYQHGTLTMTLAGTRLTEAGFRIEINTDVEDVNMIYLQMADVRGGIKVRVETSETGTEFDVAYERVVARNRVDIPIDKTNLKKVYVTLTMSNPNIVLVDQVKYEFKVEKILVMSDERKLTGIYQTGSISIEDDIAFISLAVEDETIGDCDITYYVATEVDSNDEPVGFSYIDPKQEGSLVALRSSKAELTISPPDLNDPQWKLGMVKTYGGRLYNILDILGTGKVVETDDYEIEDGVLSLLGDRSMISDTIRLYRGANDYVKKEREEILDMNVNWISILPELYDEASWVKRVPMRVRLTTTISDENITSYSGGFYNKFTIDYTALNYEEIRIIRSDGKEINDIISDISSSNSITTITLAASTGQTILDPQYKYQVTYAVSLKEYVDANNLELEIDMESLEISVLGEELKYEKDYIIHTENLEIELLKAGNYAKYYDADYNGDVPANLSHPIDLRYNFKAETNQTTEYYETHVYTDVPMDIDIIPFTASEIAKGNFHTVNEEYCSSSSYATLQKGWNKIETTQPYPSRNEYDLNIITDKTTSAGIVIPEDLVMRSYMDSMRQVPPHRLATMDITEGSKCFSYVGGKILTNFVPTFLDKALLDNSTTSDVVGESFLNKRATYGTTYDNTGWVPNPESFDLEFSYLDSGDKQVFIKLDITCNDNVSVGRVFKIGLNKYKEI